MLFNENETPRNFPLGMALAFIWIIEQCWELCGCLIQQLSRRDMTMMPRACLWKHNKCLLAFKRHVDFALKAMT